MAVAKCPNKNSKEWKKLAEHLGEAGAMVAYTRNGEEIPDYTKAPNGEESILFKEIKDNFGEKEAYRVKFKITSPQFKEWFGESKITDRNGEPIVTYHISPSKFSEFKEEYVGTNARENLDYFSEDSELGFFFSESLPLIQEINDDSGGTLGENVYATFLKMESPEASFTRLSSYLQSNKVSLENYKEVRDYIENELNMDGIIYGLEYGANEEGELEGSTNGFIVFKPDQIKSIFNEGSFSQDTNNIYKQKTSQSQETMENFERKRNILSKSLNAEVILDTELDGAGELVTGEGTPKIRVNPNYFGGDTLIHEYGHLYIDLLGGMENSMIQQGRKYLNGTDLEQRIIDTYPELSGDKLDKEILATAVGLEGEGIFDARQGTIAERFKNWLRLFFNRLKKAIGLDYNVALELADQLLSNQVTDQLQSELASDTQRQKATTASPLMSQAEIASQIAKVTQKIKDGLSTKLGKYLRILNSGTTTERQKDSIEQLKKLVEEFGKKDDVHSLSKYVEIGLSETQQMLDRLRKFQTGDLQVTATGLKNIHDYVQSYSHAEEIRNLLELDSDLHGKFREGTISKKDKTTLLEALNSMVENHSTIETLYRQQSKIFLANQFAKRDGRIHAIKREEFAREFDKNNKRTTPLVGSEQFFINGKEVSKDEYKYARQQYVNEQISDNKAEIVQQEKQYWLELFDLGPTDVGTAEAYLMDPQNINSDLVQVAHEMLDRAEMKAMHTSIEKFKTADELFVEFQKVKPESDQKEKYDEMIENAVTIDKDGNIKETGKKSRYMVGRYYSKVFEMDREFWAKIGKAEKEGNQSEVKRLEKEYKEWSDTNLKKVAGQYYPVDKWKNPQYDKLQKHINKEDVIGRMYDHIINLREDTDNRYPNFNKLTKNRWGAKFHELPSINATNMERVLDTGFINTVKQNLKDLTKIRSDDTDYRPEQVEEQGSDEQKIAKEIKRITKVMGDESGGIKQTKPIYFRGEIDPSDQSYDLLTQHLIDNSMAVNYSEKSKIHAELEMIKDISANRDVATTKGTFAKGWTRLVNYFTGQDESPVVDSGENTNAHKALVSLLESRLYGIKKVGDPTVNKWVDNLLQFTGDVMLIGNYLQASANLLHGKVMNWIESIGNTEFSQKNLANAEAKYWRDFPMSMKDFGRRRFFSKTNLLMEKLDALGDWRSLAKNFVDDTRLKQKLKKSSLHGLNSVAEHYIQGAIMYAVLDRIKVRDSKGRLLKRDKDGKIVTTDKLSEAMSLDEAYDVENGRLVLNEKVDRVTDFLGDSDKLDSEKIADISSQIRSINIDLHGQYDSGELAIASRYPAGRAFLMLKRWLPQGWMRRFRGFSTIGLERDEIRPDERFYSRARGDFRSGIYSDTFRLFWSKKYIEQLRDDGVKASYELLKQNWDEMTDTERANVRRGVMEFATMATVVGMAALIKGLAEDEDDEYTKKALIYLAFLNRRLYSEMSFYWNVRETIRIMRSPAASISLVEDGIHLIDQILTDFPYFTGMEKYERGVRAGQYKMRKDVEDVLPIFNQLNRNIEEALGYLYQDSLI